MGVLGSPSGDLARPFLLLAQKVAGTFAATWMDLEMVILSEVSQTEEKYCMTSLICRI